jgi:hypothetical protein
MEPFTLLSLKTNQLPGGSTFEIVVDLPSERRVPEGFTGAGPLDSPPDDDLALGVSPPPPPVAAAVSEHGH